MISVQAAVGASGHGDQGQAGQSPGMYHVCGHWRGEIKQPFHVDVAHGQHV